MDGLVIAPVCKGDKGLLSKYDTNFRIESLQTFHLALEGAYREDYRRDEVASATDRFEFKTGWPTVYALWLETALPRSGSPTAPADGARRTFRSGPRFSAWFSKTWCWRWRRDASSGIPAS